MVCLLQFTYGRELAGGENDLQICLGTAMIKESKYSHLYFGLGVLIRRGLTYYLVPNLHIDNYKAKFRD